MWIERAGQVTGFLVGLVGFVSLSTLSFEFIEHRALTGLVTAIAVVALGFSLRRIFS